MDVIKYHPLVDADTEGTEKVPLFMTTDEKIIKTYHKLYLSEMIPGYFRLHSREPMAQDATDRFTLYCPRCGQELYQMAKNADYNTLGLYTCKECRE